MSGYGVVARSEKMSLPLAKKIAKLSNFKDFQRIAGPQYSYRIIDCAGQTYHVLSCIQEAGSDYTGRNCHIAHHLALPKDVVRNLRQHQSRPTPAGIILSLAQSGFWLASWSGEPTRQLAEAYLSAEALPETNLQKTWLAWTSHKSNARAFSTPPYEHDCLITVPEQISSEDILRLINESDWLDHYRGWGKTFTTHGEAKDTFADTQRIFVADGDSLEGRATRTGRPILRINASFHLPIQEQLVAPEPTAQLGESEEAREETLFAKPTPISEPPAPSPIPSPPEAHAIEPSQQAELKEGPTSRKAQRRRRRSMWLLPAALLAALIGIVALMIDQAQPPHDEPSLTGGRMPQPPSANRPRPKPAPAILAPPTELVERHATLAGDLIPLELHRLLQHSPSVIEEGTLRVGCLDGNSFSMPLRKGEQNLLIEEISTGEYLLTLIQKGEEKRGLKLILRANERFESFTMNGQEAYLLLEIDDEHEHQLILLMPRYQQSVHLPPIVLDQQLDIQIKPSDITFIRSKRNPLAMRMSLTEAYLAQCPKLSLASADTSQRHITLSLPQIKHFGDNECIQGDSPDDSNELYHWQCQEQGSQNANVDFYRYRIEQRDNLGKLILAHFNKLCNRPCANNGALVDPFYSIATLYHLLEEFERDDSPTTHQALTARYCKLYSQEPFARLLQQIIPPESGVTLSPEESSLQSEECIQKRARVSKKLQDPVIRQSIKQRICLFISQELQQSITKALWSKQGQEHQIKLHKTHSVNGKAIWTFQLK